MSANQSPSNFPYPGALLLKLTRATQNCSLRWRWLIPYQHARRGNLLRVRLPLPCFRRELATVTERAASPSTMRRDHRNSQFRFEVPARIACQGGKCRRLRCVAARPGRLLPAGSAFPASSSPTALRSPPTQAQKEIGFRQLFENSTKRFCVKIFGTERIRLHTAPFPMRNTAHRDPPRGESSAPAHAFSTRSSLAAICQPAAFLAAPE